MSSPTASDLGLNLADINMDAVKIFNLVDNLKNKVNPDKEMENLKTLAEVILEMVKRLQELEQNIDVSLETLDGVILELKEAIQSLSKDNLALEQESKSTKQIVANLETRCSDLKAQCSKLKAENANLRSRVDYLEKRIKELEATIQDLISFNKELKLENSSLRQEANSAKKDLNQKVREGENVNDLSALGDFAFQFQTLLGKFIGVNRSVPIWEAIDFINDPSSDPKQVEALKMIGFGNKEKVLALKKAIKYFIDSRFSIGHPAIANQYDKSLEDLVEIAGNHNSLKFISPISEFWRKMLKKGKIFDSSTWELN